MAISSEHGEGRRKAAGDDGSPAQLRPLVLVSCAAQKQTEPAPAKELYRSAWFKKARAYAEKLTEVSKVQQWWILSARYGLLNPEVVIAPYDFTLSQLSQAERWEWARGVVRDLEAVTTLLGEGESESEKYSSLQDYRIVILAGQLYREHLITLLHERAVGQVEVPMEGLGIGQQLQWFKYQLSSSASKAA